MKFTTVLAAAALAVASTAATAENVTTAAGDVVMIEKNQGSLTALGLSAAQTAALLAIVLTVAISTTSGTE